MIIYSVTVVIDKEVAAEWKEWMITKHIPDVMKTGYFASYSMHKLLEPESEEDSETYNTQYLCDSMVCLDEYRNEAAPALQKEHAQKFQGKFAAFRTVLERISTSV